MIDEKKSIYIDSNGNEWAFKYYSYRVKNKFWYAYCNELNKTLVGMLKKDVKEKIKLFIKK